MPDSFIRDPNSVLDYEWDWSDFLLDGETIQSYTVTVAGVTKDDDSNTTTTVTARISGGTVGTTGSATCHIVTSDGREQDKTMFFKIKEL